MDNHHFWWLNPLFQWPFMVRLLHVLDPEDLPLISAQSDKNREPAQPGTPSISAKGSTNGQPITRFAKTDLERVPAGRMIMSDLERNIWIILNIFLRCLRRLVLLQQWLLPGLLVDWISLEMSHFYAPFALVTLVSHSFQGKGVVRRESSLNELDSESKGYSKKEW